MWILLCSCLVKGPGAEDDDDLSEETTSPAGDSADEPAIDISACPLVGQAWSLDLAGGSWEEPASLGAIISTYFSEEPRLYVATNDGQHLEFGGRITPGDDCLALPEADISGWPAFSVGPTEASLMALGYTLPVHDMVVAATVDEEVCGPLLSLSLQGQADMREVGYIFAPLAGSSDPDEVCALLADFSADCSACEDGEPVCMDLRVVEVPNREVSTPDCP
jgi:hypothetical protein